MTTGRGGSTEVELGSAAGVEPAESAPAPPEAKAGGYDAFVSYSRANSEFVLGFFLPALRKRSFEVWVDVDITGGAEWQDRVRRGIEGCKAFIFVVSREAVSSPACLNELQDAVALNKLIIPVIYEEIGPATIPPELTRKEWVFWRDGAAPDFLAEIVEALESDLEWRDTHTRLAGRAREWLDSGTNSSYLLRGADLRDAEAWVADQEGHRVAPTPQQASYIARSRQVAARRLRMAIAGLATALVTAIGLAALAFWQRQVAVTNQQTSQSRQLAASAEGALASDPELSTLLSLKALQISKTAQAESALRDALPQMQVLRRVVPRVPVLAVAYSPDGSRFADVSAGGTADVWTADGRQRVLRLSLGSPYNYTMTGLAFTPDGRRLLTSDLSGAITIWNLSTGKHTPLVLVSNATGPIGATSVAVDQTGRRILTGDVDGAARVWNLDGKQRRVMSDSDHAALTDARFSPRGDRVVTASADGIVRVWDVDSSTQLGEFSEPSDRALNTSEFSPNGRMIVTSSNDGTARLLAAPSGRQLSVLREPTGAAILNASFSHDGRFVVTASTDGTARIWNVASGRQVRVFWEPIHGAVSDAAFSPDGRSVLTGADDGFARTWSATTGRSLASVPAPKDFPLGDTFSPNGRLIAIAGESGTATVWDARSGAEVSAVGVGDRNNVTSLQFSPDSRRLVLVTQPPNLGGNQIADVWDVASGRQTAFLRSPDANASPLSGSFSPDNRYVVIAGLDGIARVYNAATGQLLKSVGRHGAQLAGAWFGTRDGTVTTMVGGVLRTWSVPTGKLLRTVASPAQGTSSTPDGVHVVTVTDSGAVTVWNGSTRRVLTTITLPPGAPFDSASFNRTGTRVLIGTGDGYARLWDTTTGQLLGQFDDAAGQVLPPIFSEFAAVSPDGSTLVSASGQIWKTSPREQIGAAIPGVSGPATVDTTGTRAAFVAPSGAISIWNLTSGDRVAMIDRAGRGSIRSLALNSAGTRLITAGSDGTARMYDAITGAPLRVFHEPYERSITDAVFSPATGNVLTTSVDGVIRLWSVSSGDQIRKFTPTRVPGFSAASAPPVAGAAFSRSGHLFVDWTGGSGDGIVEIHSVDGSLDYDLYMFNGPVNDASFSSDGRRVVVAAADGAAYVFDGVASNILDASLNYQPAAALASHTGPLVSASFSPDGSHLLTAGVDGVARIWDIKRTTQLTAYNLGSSLTEAAYVDHGQRVVLAGNSLTTWSTELSGALVALERLARARVTRQLTASERAQYLAGISG